ncbi:MAG: TRAP transporter substrate-binding protein DctP [Proteobacteria bacterium]|nr:TRAP transporter substrate-binding protein DctP [Pseudomonadota bacterium]
MLHRRLFISAALAATVALGAGPARADTTLVINAFLPAQDPMNTKVLKPWAEAVEKATAGRVRVQIPPTSVAAPDQLWNSVRNGVVDGAYFFNGTVPNQLKLMQMPQLPFLGTSARANSVAFWRTYEKYFKPASEYKDVHLLALMVIPTGHIYSLKGPIESGNDIRGVKIWALPGVPAKLMAMAGAGVVSTPAAKMSEIVAGGMVDGFVGIPDMHAEAFKVIRYAKSATIVPGGISTPSFSLILNRQKWESLSPQDRDIITKLSGEAFADRMAAFDEVEAAAHAQAAKEGLKYLPAPPQLVAELKKGADKMTAEWLAMAKARGIDGQAAFAYYREQSASGSK